MLRTIVVSLLVLALFAPAVLAGQGDAQIGVGFVGGWYKPSGGDKDYEKSGYTLGVTLMKPASDALWFAFDYRYGNSGGTEPSVSSPGALGLRNTDDFTTKWSMFELTALYKFNTEKSFQPWLSGGFGLTSWQVEDSDGAVPDGYNTDGKLKTLKGTNFTFIAGLGMDFFVTETVALTVGGKYRYLFDQEIDNVGYSSVYGPNYVDANTSSFEAFGGLYWYIGGGDCDGDGIYGRDDECWRDPEDFDGFEDEDGCPDLDNDGDGYLDIYDKCPDEAEDFDGEDDEDGCPDIDRDGDGILDMNDKCPDKPEDFDGFMDEDGCPDPDNDGDGVPDSRDECPNTPKGVAVGPNGCPLPKVELVAVMINFDFDKDDITDQAAAKLDAVVKMMMADEDITVEIAGHADDIGTAGYNQALSERRAAAVEAYLEGAGIHVDRAVTVGYGDTDPLVPNATEEARAENRRAVITPVR